MTIYLNTPKIHSIHVDNVDEAIELIKKLGEDKSSINVPTNNPYSPPYTIGDLIKGLYDPTIGPYYTTCKNTDSATTQMNGTI